MGQTLRQETLKFILPVTMVAANYVSAMAQSGKSPNSKEASPVKVTESDTVDPKQEAANCLAVGKRNLLVSDIPLAVSSLGEACELFTKVYGETAPECAETYFYYGKALLEMARLESGVLGNALDGVPEGEEEAENSQVEDPEKLTEDEKDDVEQKVDEALNENFDKHDKIAKIHNERMEKVRTTSHKKKLKMKRGKTRTMKLVGKLMVRRKRTARLKLPWTLNQRARMVKLWKVVRKKVKIRTNKKRKMKRILAIFNLLGKCSNLPRLFTQRP